VTSVETKYASNGSATIAYQVVGDAALDLLYVPGWFFNPEIWRDFAPIRRYMERLQSFARVVSIEKRGFGMSDRLSLSNLPTTEERVADIAAVADAEGLTRTAAMGTFEGGPLILLWAAANPQRVSHIVLINSFAKLEWEQSIFGRLAGDDRSAAAVRLWEEFERGNVQYFCPDLALSPLQKKQMIRGVRMEANPRVIEAWLPMVLDLDARHVLDNVTAKVLIIHSARDAVVEVDHARFLADNLPNARLVELPGRDHVPWGANFGAVMSEIEEFLLGRRSTPTDRGIPQTIMFTDIVESTRQLAESGDDAWKSLIEIHDRIASDLLEQFGGRYVNSTGDGFLASLPTADAALQCAQALIAELRTVGIDIRVGIHTGTCQVYGDDVVGLAVNIAARVMALARSGEVLVSKSLRDGSINSGVRFEPRGEHHLKGVPGRWPLYAAF
jgi:class 3 adenylate cyclase/pimeloyl-ACP methyl ester carboxylesterase